MRRPSPCDDGSLEMQFRAWEDLIHGEALESQRQSDGSLEIRNAGQSFAADELQEHWAQRYVKEEFKRLGFLKVDGPFKRGPDFKVFEKGRWVAVEVETQWRNYFRHKHHTNPSFDKVQYLILLSAQAPTPEESQDLPPKIIHIDRGHFLNWFKATNRNRIRIDVVAGAMQEYWVTVCSDAGRDMATCPDCDSCAYFGEGIGGEATHFFYESAKEFIIASALTPSTDANLTKFKPKLLRAFVLQKLLE